MKQILWIILITTCLVGLLGGVIWAIPHMISLFYERKGGLLLEKAIAAQIADKSNDQISLTGAGLATIPCALPSVTNEADLLRLANAEQELQKAIRYDQQAAQAYLLIGRVYCLSGRPTLAVKAYQSFLHLRPQNPLGHLELGFAYANLCGKEPSEVPKNGPCNSTDLQQSMMDEWRLAGINPDSLITEGNEAFSSHQFLQATRWYRYATLVGDIPGEEKFRWSIAEIMSGNDLTEIPDPQVLNIHDLDNFLEIDASNFQWMLESLMGKTIGNPAAGDPRVGYLPFQGEAVAAIDAHQTSTYRITIKAQNSIPPPIQIQLEIDFQPYANFELSHGDGSWQELSTNVKLNAGFHILGINFLNDSIINGIDRNAVIEWVEVSK